MKYIPNPKASNWSTYLSDVYQKIAGKCYFIWQKIVNKLRLTKINNKLSSIPILLIAAVMLLGMLFSISMIVMTGMMLFVVNAGWYGLTRLFKGENKHKLS